MAEDLTKQLRDGSGRALARVISAVENATAESPALLDELHAYTGSAYRLGVTGPPGAGKSSLVDHLTGYFRKAGEKVGIISVDPTSPFSGGAILGDRLRMSRHTPDQGVFIRSMATRGQSGGLARKSQEVGDVLDAADFGVIIFETVGVGQIELDIMEAVDTTLLVLVPESGDEIQMLKAGIIEIADIFAINKSDREGSGRLRQLLEQMLGLKEEGDDTWQPPVVATSATRGDGLDELHAHIGKHREHIMTTGLLERKQLERRKRRVEAQIGTALLADFWTSSRRESFELEVATASPYELARKLLEMNG